MAADNAILANAAFLDAVIASPEIFSPDPDDDDPELKGNDQDDSDSDEDEAAPCSSGKGRILCRGTFSDLVPEGDAHSHSHSHTHGSHSHSHSHDRAQPWTSRSGGGVKKNYRPTENDMDKLRSTLKQLVRDWSAEVRLLHAFLARAGDAHLV